MPIIDPGQFEIVDKPELVFGIAAAVGTPLDHVCRALGNELTKRSYECAGIHLSEFLRRLNLESPLPGEGVSEFERINRLMDRGDELRRLAEGGEALAFFAVAYINDQRPDRDPPCMPGKAFILRQLKHPDEVFWLRKIYGPAFHLIGVYCPERVRKQNLETNHGMTGEQSEALIKRDMDENVPYGQHLRDTFHLADVFVEMSGHDDKAGGRAAEQLKRYFKLLFGEGIITPTVDEYGMHLAYSASLRSADLSRQVGAAIVTKNKDIVSLGTNEVPTARGGQYWEGDKNDSRDARKGFDANASTSQDILREILEMLQDGFAGLNREEQELALKEVTRKLGPTRLMDLTEFGRAVHAEMEALLAAGRLGVSARGCILYATTFPCHNCAKHIVGAGIARVVYIEPYPKSMARELHDDSIAFPEDESCGRKTRFEPFVGVAPRMYWTLFSIMTPEGRRLKRKTSDGKVIRDPLGLRISASPLTYTDRESIAAQAANKIGRLVTEGSSRNEQDAAQ